MLQVLATCCYSLQHAIETLDSSGLVMSWASASEAADALMLHAKSFSWLSSYFFEKRELLFRMRPKSHYVMHQAIFLKETALNLNSFNTFSEESFLGSIKMLAVACHGKTMTSRIFSRYLLCLALMVRKYQEPQA